jgi:predicted TPR repeat methyltransferase
MTTRPSQMNATFDTSLIDLSPEIAQQEEEIMTEPDADVTFQDSFSTTDTAPSEDYKQAIKAHQDSITSTMTPMPVASEEFSQASTTKAKVPVRYVPTVDAYDAWAGVYDSDGNILQSVDDLELSTLLPKFVKMVSEASAAKGEKSVKVVDLGCGTGRNTVKLLASGEWEDGLSVEVTGIDASKGMLRVAEEKLGKAMEDIRSGESRTWKLIQHDFLDPEDARRPPIPLPPLSGSSNAPHFAALITTLVLEHIPLSPFFTILSSLVSPGGLVLLTNMHPDMGSKSQAGFVSADEEGKAVKVRGTSWAHGVSETIEAAGAVGFDVVGTIGERGIQEEMVGKEVGERGMKWIGVKVWYGGLFRKRS